MSLDASQNKTIDMIEKEFFCGMFFTVFKKLYPSRILKYCSFLMIILHMTILIPPFSRGRVTSFVGLEGDRTVSYKEHAMIAILLFLKSNSFVLPFFSFRYEDGGGRHRQRIPRASRSSSISRSKVPVMLRAYTPGR